MKRLLGILLMVVAFFGAQVVMPTIQAAKDDDGKEKKIMKKEIKKAVKDPANKAVKKEPKKAVKKAAKKAKKDDE